MSVSAIVVSHGHADDVERLVPVLRPQVDELVLVENLPGSVRGAPDGARVLRNALCIASSTVLGEPCASASKLERPGKFFNQELIAVEEMYKYQILFSGI